MIKVGSMVQSKYVLSSGKEGNLGLVMELRCDDTYAHIYYAKTRTFGWVESKDMKVVA